MSLSSIDQQPLLVRRDVGLDAIEGVLEVLGRRRLDQIGERPVRQPVLAFLLDRQDLHRNVARRRIELEVVEDRPSQHVRQEDVQGDGGRQILLGQRDRRLAAVGHDALESFVAGEAEQHPRVVRIVVDDQQHVVAVADALAIVGDDLFGLRHREHRQRRGADRMRG